MIPGVVAGHSAPAVSNLVWLLGALDNPPGSGETLRVLPSSANTTPVVTSTNSGGRVLYADPDLVVAIGSNFLRHSQDGAKTFTITTGEVYGTIVNEGIRVAGGILMPSNAGYAKALEPDFNSVITIPEGSRPIKSLTKHGSLVFSIQSPDTYDNAKIMRSSDGGATWTLASSASGNANGYSAQAAIRSNGATIIACIGSFPTSTILRSTNGGASFTSRTISADATSSGKSAVKLAVDKAGSGRWLLAIGGRIWRAEAAASAWTLTPFNTANFGGGEIAALDIHNNEAMVCGDNGLLARSLDAGTSWAGVSGRGTTQWLGVTAYPTAHTYP